MSKLEELLDDLYKMDGHSRSLMSLWIMMIRLVKILMFKLDGRS